MVDAAAGYIAGATRFKEVWDGSFRKADEGGRLTPRDLVEMHAAGLGLVWATHTIDLDSALAVLHQVAAASPPGTTAPPAAGTGSDRFRHQASRVLEARLTNS
jgi:hypothetical protein